MPHATVVGSSTSKPSTPRNHACVKVPHSNLSSEGLRTVVLAANSDGISMLRRGQAAAAFEQLKYAEAVLAANPETSAGETDLLALTCSNLGCYYRKAGLPRAALRYLGRALKLEETSARDLPQDACSLATTKLNACAALSGLGSHEEAERLAMEATRLLVTQASPDSSGAPGLEESSLLAVACHNLGAEREHLGRWASAAVAFRQGAEIASRALGPDSEMARALTASCGEALSRAEKHPTTPDRPSTSRPRGAAPKRPWLRNVGLTATTGSSAGSKPPSRRAAARNIRSAPPLSMQPTPIDLSDWGMAMASPMTNVEARGGSMEAEAAVVERQNGSKATLAATSETDGLEEEPDQDPAMQELNSILSRSQPGVEHESSAEDWGEASAGGTWRGNGRVRVMSPESGRGPGPAVPASVVAAAPRQSIPTLDVSGSKAAGGLSARRRENSAPLHPVFRSG